MSSEPQKSSSHTKLEKLSESTQEKYREELVDDIYATEMTRTVMVTANGPCSDSPMDDDGDGIYAIAMPSHSFEEGEALRVQFPQGMSPEKISRQLQKIVAVLEGKHGYEIVNLGLNKGDLNTAERDEDGGIRTYNGYEEMVRLVSEYEKTGGLDE